MSSAVAFSSMLLVALLATSITRLAASSTVITYLTLNPRPSATLVTPPPNTSHQMRPHPSATLVTPPPNASHQMRPHPSATLVTPPPQCLPPDETTPEKFEHDAEIERVPRQLHFSVVTSASTHPPPRASSLDEGNTSPDLKPTASIPQGSETNDDPAREPKGAVGHSLAEPGGVDGAQPGDKFLSTGSSDTATTLGTCNDFPLSISQLLHQILPAVVLPFSKQVEPTGIGTTEEDESQQRVEAPAPETSRDPAQQLVSPSLQRVHQEETVVLQLLRSLLVCTVGGNQEMCYHISVSHLLQINASLRALLLGCGGMPVRLCTPWEMVEAEQGFMLSVGECLEVLVLGDIGLQRKALSLLASVVDCRVICSQQGLLQCGDLTRCGALVDMENDVILVDVVRVCSTISTPNSFLCKVMKLTKTVLHIRGSYHCHDDMSSEVGARLQCVVDECSPYQARQKDMDEHTLVNLLCRLLDVVNNT